MPIQVILLIGQSHSGKSTLCRCLTGKSYDEHIHTGQPNRNIMNLTWLVNGQPSPEKTLVFQSSINEGQRYQGTRFNPDIPANTISPADLIIALDRYAIYSGAVRAIIPISSSVDLNRVTGWNVHDYENHINATWNGAHIVTHVIHLDQHDTITIHPAATLNIPNPRPTINSTAMLVRNFINLI